MLIVSVNRNGTQCDISPAQFCEARRGVELMFPGRFSAENADDIFGQALVGYVEWLRDNPPASNPVGWILKCARWRAANLFDKQARRPRSTSLDTMFHLADESTPTPEQHVLETDRRAQVREALGHLSTRERTLLVLAHGEGRSVREAGRMLGWQKSAADRHDKAAVEKMRALLLDRQL